jgi:hypothetical protein
MFSLPRFSHPWQTQNTCSRRSLSAPAEIIYRPKRQTRRFVPGFATPRRDDCRIFVSRVLEAKRLYNPQFVQEKIENDKRGLEDNAHVIWTLLCNELWFRTFFS